MALNAIATYEMVKRNNQPLPAYHAPLFTAEETKGVEKALQNGYIVRKDDKPLKLPSIQEIVLVLSATDGIGYGRRYEKQAEVILKLFKDTIEV